MIKKQTKKNQLKVAAFQNWLLTGVSEAGEGRHFDEQEFYSWGKCTMALMTDLYWDWMTRTSSILAITYINYIYQFIIHMTVTLINTHMQRYLCTYIGSSYISFPTLSCTTHIHPYACITCSCDSPYSWSNRNTFELFITTWSLMLPAMTILWEIATMN